MSNFQRTRSKVWWGDGPPNVGSPVAQAPDWNASDYVPKAQDDWEPQLPHWIGNEPIIPPMDKSDSVSSPNLDQAPVWPQRQGSPGSHKSQDSGFSDSDSSPPVSQYYSSPDTSDLRSSKKCSNNEKSTEPDTNNNEDITSKSMNNSKDEQSVILDNTVIMRPKEPLDKTNEPNSNTMKQRFRSSSVIQTPYDLQKYIEVHSDEAHLDLLIDKDKENEEKRVSNESKKKIQQNNVHNHHTHSDKCTSKKTFVESQNDKTRSIKVAQIKDLSPTSKKNKQDQIEYIHLTSNDQIAVNNQPRIRSPITRVSYVTRVEEPPETPLILSNAVNFSSNSSRKYCRSQSQEKDETVKTYEIVATPTRRNDDLTPKVRSYRHYRRSQSQEIDETDANIKTDFQRNRLNKSLNYEAQHLDQQILDIQDYQIHGNSKFYTEFDNSSSSLATRNITDSLQLKTHKKPGPKAKQKYQARSDKNKSSKCTFRIFPTLRRETPRAVGDYAGGVLQGSRVPALGLPRSQDDNQWVMVGYPDNERLVQQYNERLIGGNIRDEDNNKPVQIKEPQSRNIPPPLQYQDADQVNTEMRNRYSAHNLKQDKLKSSTDHIHFLDGEFNAACTSTPKMLAPKEYMANATTTPQNPARKHPRPPRMNLLDNFNESLSATPNNLNESLASIQVEPSKLEQACGSQPEPVQYWLCDVVGAYESECMTTLQSKALGSEMKALVSANSATITGNIKKVQTHGQIIVHQYSDVLRSLNSSGHCTKECEEQICFLVANINEFILAHSITLNTKPPGETPERWDKVKLSLQVYLQRLIDIGEDVKVELNESVPEIEILYRHLDSLVDIFIETTKAVLIQQLKTLVSLIEEPPSDMILKSTLTSVSHLAMLVSIEAESNLHAKCVKIMRSISDLPFVDCCVPRALLTSIIESNKSSIKALSLRALATICVTGDAVKQFEEAGGIEIISDILSDKSNPEPQIREAITVLTQITAPWLKGHYDLMQLHTYLDGIIKYMSDIITRTSCCQLLLLCTACIVNLTRTVEAQNEDDTTDNKCDMIDILSKYNSIVKLLEAVKHRGPNISVFLQEQTSSLLSLISQGPSGLSLLSQANVVTVALVCFVRPRQAGPPRRPTEARAHYRMLHHTVNALSRLCMVPNVATQIIQLEGVPRLIRLVRTQRDQSDDVEGCSDQILMACLKTLRCLHKYHADAFLQYPLDVQQMIQPHLMESLVLFSAKQESYV